MTLTEKDTAALSILMAASALLGWYGVCGATAAFLALSKHRDVESIADDELSHCLSMAVISLISAVITLGAILVAAWEKWA